MSKIISIIATIIITGGFAIEYTNNNKKETITIPNESKQAMYKPLMVEADTEPVEAPKETAETVIMPITDTTPPVVQETAKAVSEPAPAKKTETKPATTSNILTRKFRLNNGKYKTGKELVDYVKGNPNGLKLWTAFSKYGEEEANKSAITLFYENARIDPLFRGVCTKKYAENGDIYRCVYSNGNPNGGMDSGLISINVWWYRAKIKALAGGKITCNLSSMATARDYKNACTKQYVDAIHDVDTNIELARQIYEESGNSFRQWHGYKRAGLNK
jgi:hypothetical protein